MDPTCRLHSVLGAALLLLSLASGCTRKPEEGAVSAAPPANEPFDQPRILATIPSDVAAPTSAPIPGMPLHQPLAGEYEFIFGENGGGVAFVAAQRGASLVVHDERRGKSYSAVGQVVLSQDGRRCAYPALAGGKWRMVVDGSESDRAFDAIKYPAFSLDGAHLAYQAMDGERWYIVVDGKVNAGTPGHYLQHELSADGSRVAFIEAAEGEGRGTLVVSDAAFARRADVAAGVASVVVSPDRSVLAAVVARKGLEWVITTSFSRPDQIDRGPESSLISSIAFAEDGGAPVYVAERAGRRVVIHSGREAPLPPGDVVEPLVVGRGGRVVAALMSVAGRVQFKGLLGEQPGDGASYEEAEGLVFSPDGRSHAYAARRGQRWFVVVNGKEGPPYDRVVTPQFGPDGKILAYRARLQGSRFVVIADARGRLVATHPAYEQVFPVRFTSDGKAVAYGVKDGRQLLWKVEGL